MALPKKKSRLITVNDQQYRYIITTGKYNEKREFYLNVIAQIASGEGAKMKVVGLVTRDFWLDFPYNITSKEDYPILTPKDIVLIIKNSIHKGWKPTEKGTPFMIRLDNSFVSKYSIN